MSLETKFEEVISVTSDISQMRNKYLSERLIRQWHEDFVDEDTGETVAIERNEIILEKGTLLQDHELSEINFYLQSGDIKEVSVSNQQRECRLSKRGVSIWIASVDINSKNKNIYLYADSIDTARDIITDFVEQRYSGSFRIKSLKESDYCNIIPYEEESINFYKVESEIHNIDEDEKYQQNFILNADDVESAKTIIIAFLTKVRKENRKESSFELNILSAKVIACKDLINHNFSKKYIENIDQ